MPRCFACIHCGKCGPPSSDAKVKPAGWCIFCRTQNEADAKMCANCGKPLPMVDRIVFSVEKEAVPLQTKFLQGYYDSPFIDRVDTGLGYLVAMADDPDKAALYGEKALQFPKTVQAGFWYLGFNWLDPVVGGGRISSAEKS